MTMPIDTWQTPVSHYKPQRAGRWEIRRRVLSAGHTLDMAGQFAYREALAMEDLVFTVLWDLRSGKTWMSDTPAEYYAMWELTARSIGPNVLVGGLGLGVLGHILAAQPSIESVTVVELEPDVVALVQKYLPPKVKVIIGDFLVKAPELGQRQHFNTVIADIWERFDDAEFGIVRKCQEMMEKDVPQARRVYWDAHWVIDQGVALMARMEKAVNL